MLWRLINKLYYLLINNVPVPVAGTLDMSHTVYFLFLVCGGIQYTHFKKWGHLNHARLHFHHQFRQSACKESSPAMNTDRSLTSCNCASESTAAATRMLMSCWCLWPYCCQCVSSNVTHSCERMDTHSHTQEVLQRKYYRRALGGAHVPPTKLFPRLAVNKTILEPRVTRRCSDGRPIHVRGIFPT